MKLAITGASGFLGVNLIKELLKCSNHVIIAYTRNVSRLKERFLDREDRLRIITNIYEVDWNEVDILLNLAFPRSDDGIQMAKGLGFVSDLFTAASEGGVGAVINISSQSVYSQYRKEPATEEMELNLESTYATGKYATELLLNSICKNIPHTNIRLGSLIGVELEQRVVNRLILSAYKNGCIKIENSNDIFSFLDVRDAASAITRVLNDDGKWDEVYNLGSENEYSLHDISTCIVDEFRMNGNNINVIKENSVRKNSIYRNTSIDSCKFRNRFNWKNEYDLMDSIEYIYRELCLQHSLL